MPGGILVLDDEEDFARMLLELLRHEGFRVEMSTRPSEVIGLLDEKEFELIVSDYKMPEMDGYEFLKRAREVNPELPVIMISGFMNTPELMRVANVGVTLVLEKPFDREVFLEYVKRYVEPELEPGVNRDRPLAPLRRRGRGYPPKLQFLADESTENQALVARLWEASCSTNHLFMALPPGSEFDLAVQEVSAWKGFGGQSAFQLTTPELGTSESEELLERLAKNPQRNQVVTVSDVDEADSELRSRVVRFVRSSSVHKARRNLVFIYKFVETSKAVTEDAYPSFLRDRLLRFTPLCERPADLAVYAQRLISSFNPALREGESGLDTDAARLLLAYSWPGNYRELRFALHRSVHAAGEGPVQAQHLLDSLKSRGAKLPKGWEDWSLETALHQWQRIRIQEKLSENGKPRPPSAWLGRGAECWQSLQTVEEQPFLYPELLQAEKLPETK